MRNAFRSSFLICYILMGLNASWASARPIIEKFGRAEVNWSELQISYYGEATANPQSQYAQQVNEAMKEAETAIVASVEDIREGCGPYRGEETSRHAVEAANRVVNSASTVDTIYYADGAVRVEFSNHLARAVLPVRGTFAEEKSNQDPEATGIILKINGKPKPTPIFQVEDSSGAELFGLKDVVRTSYYRNLMGRWYSNPSPQEMLLRVGPNPETIEVSSKEPGVFVANRNEWDSVYKKNLSLFQEGKIILQVQ